MTLKEIKQLENRLNVFLEKLLEPMGRSERRHWAQLYVKGLMLDGDRKSVEPMSTRLGVDAQSMSQFVGQSPWEVQEVQKRLAGQVIEHLRDPEVWMIDETSFPKAGKESVGVARQYCGALGKIANCQVAVSLHWSTTEQSCPVYWRLYLPKEWTEDRARRQTARIPDQIEYRTKNELALDLLDEALSADGPPLPVVADSAYGNDYSWRQALRARGLPYAVSVEPTTKVWMEDSNQVALAPQKATGRPRKYPSLTDLPPAQDLLAVAQSLPSTAWKKLTWRQGTKEPQRSRFAKVQVWASHGWKRQEHPLRVAEWLIIEWPENSSAPTDYWMAQLKTTNPSLLSLVSTARSRWRVEMDYRELKEELGLDHYEGRNWLGWHHHVTLVSMAFAFLRTEQSRSKKNGWSHVADNQENPPILIDPIDRKVSVV
jgi:SRSO17 transposase